MDQPEKPGVETKTRTVDVLRETPLQTRGRRVPQKVECGQLIRQGLRPGARRSRSGSARSRCSSPRHALVGAVERLEATLRRLLFSDDVHECRFASRQRGLLVESAAASTCNRRLLSQYPRRRECRSITYSKASGARSPVKPRSSAGLRTNRGRHRPATADSFGRRLYSRARGPVRKAADHRRSVRSAGSTS